MTCLYGRMIARHSIRLVTCDDLVSKTRNGSSSSKGRVMVVIWVPVRGHVSVGEEPVFERRTDGVFIRFGRRIIWKMMVVDRCQLRRAGEEKTLSVCTPSSPGHGTINQYFLPLNTSCLPSSILPSALLFSDRKPLIAFPVMIVSASNATPWCRPPSA
jgi:hypothetical protein